MSTAIIPVESREDLKRFVLFPYRLYRGSPYWVPPLIRDELDTLSPASNPAYEQAEARLFLARRNGTVVGRVAAILSHAANRKYGTRNLRFGWFDSIRSGEVARALLDAAAAWGRGHGMATMTGPQGFTDLDPEGMLVEGFQERATIATIYNHPYYPALVERCGFQKEIDYLEFQGTVPPGTVLPEKMVTMSEWAARRSRVALTAIRSGRELQQRFGPQIFDLLDESFAELYGTVPLTPKQKSYYIRKYLPLARPDLIKVACGDDGEMVGFMIALPSLSGAFQRAHGRLLPLGLLHILLALRKFDSIDFMLAGVRKPFRGKGIDRLMVVDMFRTALSHGVRVAESNPELETNHSIQNEWKIVPRRQHKRRRIYTKVIG